MLRSRMFTTAFRFFAGLATVSLVARVRHRLHQRDPGTDGPHPRARSPWAGRAASATTSPTPSSSAVGAMAAALAGILIAFRDADPEAEAQVVHTETVPLTRAPAGNNFLPVLGAFALVLTMRRPGHRHGGSGLRRRGRRRRASPSSGPCGPGPSGPPATPRSTPSSTTASSIRSAPRSSPSCASPSWCWACPGCCSPSPRPARSSSSAVAATSSSASPR